MNIQYGPIERWPGKLRTNYRRRSARFKKSYSPRGRPRKEMTE